MDVNDNQKLAAISAEAARWFVQLRDGALNMAGQYEYLLWLKESPAHVAEMLRACQVYVLLQAAKLEPLDAREGTPPNVIALESRERVQVRSVCADVRRWKLAAAVMGLACAALLAVVAANVWRTRAIETAPGEWRIIALADGTTLKMGPRSRLMVDFQADRRAVHFARGEAVFQVAHDPARPFVVDTEFGSVRALGTAFGLARHADRLVVIVAEGAVAVSRVERDPISKSGADADVNSVEVPAGHQTSMGSGWSVAPHQVDAERALAWADGWLVFVSETWGEAIEEFNRRNRVQIEVSDEVLRNAPIRGRFLAADPEAFAKVLAASRPAELIRSGPELLRIEPRTKTPEGVEHPAR